MNSAETSLFVQYFNEVATTLPSCSGYLPFTEENIFEKLTDGIFCGRLLEAVPKAKLNSKLLNIPATDDQSKKANHSLVLAALRKNLNSTITCNEAELLSGEHIEMHDYTWEVLRAHLLRYASLNERLPLIRSLKKGEDLTVLLSLDQERVVLRWVNYHLEKAGEEKRVKRFSVDFKDVEVWVHVLGQVCSELKQKFMDVLGHTTLEERATALLNVCKSTNPPLDKYATVESIVLNYWRVNMAFTANIFNNFLGMFLPSEEEMDKTLKSFQALRVKLADCEAECNSHRKTLEALEQEKGLCAAQERCAQTWFEIFEPLNFCCDWQLLSRRDQLNGQLGKLEEEKAKLQRELEKQDLSVHEVSDKLINTTNLVNTKSRDVADHIEKVNTLIEESCKRAPEANVELALYDASDENASLSNALRAQEKLLNFYKMELKAKQEDHVKRQEAAESQLAEINELVSEFLDTEQSDALDAINNLKRLLELLVEKCKRQSLQIAMSDSKIEKIDDLNALFSEKVRDYAEQQIEKKKKKK